MNHKLTSAFLIVYLFCVAPFALKQQDLTELDGYHVAVITSVFTALRLFTYTVLEEKEIDRL